MARRDPVVPPRDQRVPFTPNWAERVRVLRYLPAFVRLVWKSHRGYATAMITLRLLRAFLPVFVLWIGKLLLDAIVRAMAGANAAPLWHYLALEIVLVATSDIVAHSSAVVEALLGDVFTVYVTIQIMDRTTSLDLAQLEAPAVQDQLERARGHGTERVTLLGQVLSIVQDTVTLMSLGVVLVRHSPWLGLLLILAALPAIVGYSHFASQQYSLLARFTAPRRELGYLQFVATAPEMAKEIQSFGLGTWIVNRYRLLAERFTIENAHLAIRKGAAAWGLGLLSLAAYYVGYAGIVVSALRGAISIGQVTFLVASFGRSRDLLQRSCVALSDIYEQCLYLGDLFSFLNLAPRMPAPAALRKVAIPVHDGLRLENVGFRYLGSDQWALRNVSFTLQPHERIALVGENGAGKTTLAKLLVRLYEPSEGRILLDGVDLREYDLASFRSIIGVVFQDFIRFQMRLDENIGVGHIESVAHYLDESLRERAAQGDRPVPDCIRIAAEQSLASSLLPRLPDGYRQMLGNYFVEGIQLSGGEWQKVALARAYLRDAQLLVLDEPTSSLDVRAEAEVFRRFGELACGRMAVFITHRLWTVRNADRIVVLSDSTAAQVGTHDDLMARGGLYAELFNIQSAAYG